jgi:hypothetical protein
MSRGMRWWPRRGDQLVVARRYPDRAAAEEGWSRLAEADIPATVVEDPGTFGTPTGADLMVARRDVDEAQAILATAGS